MVLSQIREQNICDLEYDLPYHSRSKSRPLLESPNRRLYAPDTMYILTNKTYLLLVPIIHVDIELGDLDLFSADFRSPNSPPSQKVDNSGQSAICLNGHGYENCCGMLCSCVELEKKSLNCSLFKLTGKF